MPFKDEHLTVTVDGDQHWRLTVPLVYEGERDTFSIPAGYRTDFATVPRLVAWFVPRFGRYTRAAVLHDWLITDAIPAGRVTPVDADGLFRRVMREQGVSAPRRWVMWAGVRWGSLFGGRHAGWLVTAPAVLAVSVAVLPVVAVGAVPVTVALLAWWVVELAGWVLGGCDGPAPGPNLRT